jgi:hypothetical protein
MQNKTLFQKVKQLPILGVIILIANGYAASGEISHFQKLTSWNNWYQRIVKNLVLFFIFGAVFSYTYYNEITSVGGFKPEEAILDIFPDILGFGIGVFALLFTLPSAFLARLRRTNSKSKESNSKFGAHMLPVDMAYPLMVYCFIMFIAAIFRMVPDSPITIWISCSFLLYGFYMCFELLSSIFNTASLMVMVRKLEDKNKEQEQEQE